MDIKDKISSLYNLISQEKIEKHIVPELLFTIIQLKALHTDSIANERSIYQDSKLFVTTYIASIEERDLGYDIINIDKIIKCINVINNLEEKYQLLNYVDRLLKNNNFKEESIIIRKYLNKTKTKLLIKKKYHFGKYFNLLLHLSTYNLWSLLLTITILFIITYTILLPAPFESWCIFNITYKSYSDNFFINHFLNLTTCLFDVNGNCQIETSSAIGIFYLILVKLLYIIFIVNFFYQKIINFINNN